MAYPSPDPAAPARVPRLPLSLAAAALLLLPLAALAEEDADSPLRPGAWAAEFEIDPSLDYGSVYTGSATLAVKRHSSAGRALRFGVAVNFRESEGDGTEDLVVFDPPIYPTATAMTALVDRHTETHSYAVFLHLVRERPVRDRVALFVEAGPSFRFSELQYYREDVSFYPGLPAYRYVSDNDEVTRAVALDLNLGFEWLFSKRLSLGARFGAFADYAWGSRIESYAASRDDGSSFQLNRMRTEPHGVDVFTRRAAVTLAAYF